MPTARKKPQPKSDPPAEGKPTKSASPGHDREGLTVALSRLKPALRGGGAIPELGHIWFEDGWASTYNGGLGIRVALDLGLDCGLPGAPLIKLLGTSSLKEVSLEPGAEHVQVKLGGRSRPKLVSLPSARNPWRFPAEHDDTETLSPAAIEALRAVLISKPSAETRLEHRGVAVYATKEGADFYATDSRTLAMFILEDEAAARLPKFLFLPRPFVEQVVELCPQGAELVVAEDYLAALGRGVEIYANLLDTQGIEDLPALVERTHKPHPAAVPIPAGLEVALDRAEALSSGDATVNLKVSGNKLRVSGKYAYGELPDESLVLEEPHAGDVDFVVLASVLRRGLLVADAMSMTAGSLALYREENFLYLVAAHAGE